jgi:hypothetical protein
MSLDLARMSTSGNINTNHSNTTSTVGSISQAAPHPSGNRNQRQSAASHNIWRKGSDGG